MRPTRLLPPVPILIGLGLLGLWHVVGHFQVHRRMAALRREGWPTSAAELAAMQPRAPAGESLPDALRLVAAGLPPQWVIRNPLRADAYFSNTFLTRLRWRTQLEENAAVLETFNRVRSRTNLFPSPWFNPEPAKFSRWTRNMEQLASLLMVRALVAAHEGRTADAVVSLQDLLGMARSLEEFRWSQPQTLHDSLIMEAAETTALLVSRTRLTEGQLKELQDEFARVPDLPTLRNSLTGVAALGIDLSHAGPVAMSQALAGLNGVPSERIALRLLTALQFGAGLHLRDRVLLLDQLAPLLRVLDRPGTDLVEEVGRFPALTRELNDPRWMRLRPITAKVLGEVSEVLTAHRRTVALARAAFLVCAIERYRLAHGGDCPRDLSELEPVQISFPPEDPFNGCPMRYRRLWEGYMVYSVGENQEDGQNFVYPRSASARYRYGRQLPEGEPILRLKVE